MATAGQIWVVLVALLAGRVWGGLTGDGADFGSGDGHGADLTGDGAVPTIDEADLASGDGADLVNGEADLTSDRPDMTSEADATQLDRQAADFIAKLNQDYQLHCNQMVKKRWNFNANLTDHNQKIMNEYAAEYASYQKEKWAEVIQWDWMKINDPLTRRQFKHFSTLGPAALPDEKFKMLEDIMMNSTDPEELKHVWLQWREQSGKKMRKDYIQFAGLINDIAWANNFTDGTDMWLDDYDTPDFRERLAALWEEVAPLYRQLHAFVRGRLRARYGDSVVSRSGPIPAHLLGNMWAQAWGNIIDICKPYPEKKAADVSAQMKEAGYTPVRMFRLSEEFFTSLGLEPMPDTFWNLSVLERPADGRELVCHASAWDFCDQRDFRIKQCTVVSMDQLITVHHEMGHIQYYIQYKDLPMALRRGANSGFHEALGDTLALSVQTRKHLKKIGLLKEEKDDPEVDLNFLMLTALDKIAFLPFGYLIDKWRWDLFSNVTSPEDLNCAWWKLREELQGVKPPQPRSEADFDPGAKYHVPANTPYVRYFVARILQFQFHKALCQAAGEYDPQDSSRPLHQCDIYQSKEAGKLLSAMMRLGHSVPWPDALEAITGQRAMDASPLREYFRPLEEWLTKENERTGETVGWKSGTYIFIKGVRKCSLDSNFLQLMFGRLVTVC
ncbi:Angiotensin-converting enzyme [Amphibalanus amphitrite]|uniref:Angiotensin-converting enzyme n=1 Tax=Amphibalanus amphitrite TaxID=1232801 RepID=A0A6A4WR58_AMPAM|nr:Angiotensin-converting enzyme [Amphibalanus amphitrite]